MDFNNLLVGTIPLMLVIFGLVEFIKSFGISGKPLTILSMLLGVAFGIAYQFYLVGFPLVYSGWFEIIIFGLAIGLAASGFYKFVNNRIPPK
jgi:hypothetical protein